MKANLRRAIRKVIEEIARENDTEIGVSFDARESMAYDWGLATVIIGYDFDDKEATDLFLAHLEEVHNCVAAHNFSARLWTLLHEIGHHFTLDEIDVEDEFTTRAMLSVISVPTDTQTKHNAFYQYFDLPSEYEATEWAAAYVENNYDKCIYFDRLLNKEV